MTTMDDKHGDGSNHEVCDKCGYCKPCNDCQCNDNPNRKSFAVYKQIDGKLVKVKDRERY